MNKFLLRPIYIGLLISTAPAIGAEPNIKEGLWEITVTVNMAGTQIPPTAVQQCFGASDVADAKHILPTGGICDVSNYKFSGNSATWDMQCKGATAASGSGNATFSPTSFSGTLTIALQTGSETTQINQTFSAHRIGDCVKSPD